MAIESKTVSQFVHIFTAGGRGLQGRRSCLKRSILAAAFTSAKFVILVILKCSCLKKGKEVFWWQIEEEGVPNFSIPPVCSCKEAVCLLWWAFDDTERVRGATFPLVETFPWEIFTSPQNHPQIFLSLLRDNECSVLYSTVKLKGETKIYHIPHFVCVLSNIKIWSGLFVSLTR